MENLDPAQYANQQGVSLHHYLIKMINFILTDTDNSKKGEGNAKFGQHLFIIFLQISTEETVKSEI